MLEDSKATMLLTSAHLKEDLPRGQAQAICLDADANVIAKHSAENPISVTRGHNPLYVMYTSGSTGKPKAVLGPHRGVINRLAWMWAKHPFADGEVCCQKIAPSFVDSVIELFDPLLQGIPSVIIPEEIARDPQRLIPILADHRVTRIGLVPSLLQAILDHHPDLQHRLPCTRIWRCGGEALPAELCQRFQKVMPGCLLFNLYGSTEVSACATWYDASPSSAERMSIPIGRPLPNVQTYVLDADLQPTPIGVPGELYVGGIGLALGYLNRAVLTAGEFVPNPFSPEPGTRIYRTGDRARYLSDSNIEFLGRIGHQVKIRGIRIELGEIEAVLGQHPAVKQAVVLVREYDSDKRLVAYLVANDEPVVSIGELRSFARSKLPEYMVPAAYMTLDALPLTPSGKIDRGSLPEPDLSRRELEQAFVPPQSPVEEVLAGIWTQVLGLERVGIHDDFFDLGGHSLLATRVFARVRDALGVGLSLRSIFETPTIAGLATSIETLRWLAQDPGDDAGSMLRDVLL
jgi:amino acid adenylation domain-containing protein